MKIKVHARNVLIAGTVYDAGDVVDVSPSIAKEFLMHSAGRYANEADKPEAGPVTASAFNEARRNATAGPAETAAAGSSKGGKAAGPIAAGSA